MTLLGLVSLSARRAWIEIRCSGLQASSAGVALRKESVDRNTGAKIHDPGKVLSLSARRAWIEIPGPKSMTPER